jgi:hypothetical protein
MLAVAGPAAGGAKLSITSLTGGIYESDRGPLGTYAPFKGLDVSGVANNSYGLGVSFAGQTVVESLTIIQFRDNWQRRMIDQFDVYANGELVGMVRLQNDPTLPHGTGKKEFNEQTVPILGLDGVTPITLTATWITLVLNTQHSASDARSAIEDFWFNGTPCDTSNYETNLNLHKEFTPTNNYTGGGHGGHGPGSVVLDGNLHSAAVNGRSMFWVSDDGQSEQSFTVHYGSAQPVVGSVGISFLSGHGDRNIPKWVIISDSHDNYIKIDVDPMMFQYNRYDQGWLVDADGTLLGDEMVCFDDYFTDTTSLKLTFPRWNDLANNWWTNSSNAYGLTEFQAFAERVPDAMWAPIPEPATMTLLALGGLAMLRRKRN